MRVILGIGNPGKRYLDTRHNIGFILLDYFVNVYNLKFVPSKGEYYQTEGVLDNQRFLLVKPTTFMNLSGVAAADVLNEYQINVEDILVIGDDINLPLGQIRVRQSGGDGGHNGIKSLIYHLNSNQFPRIRYGIGRNFEDGKMADYVLTQFTSEEVEIITPSLKFCSDLFSEFIKGGYKQLLDFYSKNIKSLQNNNSNNTKTDGS